MHKEVQPRIRVYAQENIQDFFVQTKEFHAPLIFVSRRILHFLSRKINSFFPLLRKKDVGHDWQSGIEYKLQRSVQKVKTITLMFRLLKIYKHPKRFISMSIGFLQCSWHEMLMKFLPKHIFKFVPNLSQKEEKLVNLFVR